MRGVLVAGLVLGTLFAGCMQAADQSATATTAPDIILPDPPRTWPTWKPLACDPNPAALPSHNALLLGPSRFNHSELIRRVHLLTGLRAVDRYYGPGNASADVAVDAYFWKIMFGSAWPSRNAAEIAAKLRSFSLGLGFTEADLGPVRQGVLPFDAEGIAFYIRPANNDTAPPLVTYNAYVQPGEGGGWVTEIQLPVAYRLGAKPVLNMTQAVDIARQYAQCSDLPIDDIRPVKQLSAIAQESLAWDVRIVTVHGTHCGDEQLAILIDAGSGAVLATKAPGPCI
ncbi:MAG: hypothetical protein V4510_09570 [bacterium]